MANQGSSDIVEKDFKIEMVLRVITNRRDGGPTEDEVMRALNSKITGQITSAVSTLDKPILQGDSWACISISGEVKENPKLILTGER